MRIEHRVVPAGPTIKDCIANAAFYFGLVRGFGLEREPVEERLAFAVARENFYTAARYGLEARVCWAHGNGVTELPMRNLIVDNLMLLARRGLESANIPDSDVSEYLDVIASRVDSGQNGAAWQRLWVDRNGPDFNSLVREYRVRQDKGSPVHTWDF